jgi:hypothetical protein
VIVEFPLHGIGDLLVVTLAGVYIFLLVVYIALEMFSSLLRTIKQAAGRV